MNREKKTVLVIEDEQEVNEAIGFILGESGYMPVSAFTGEDGIELARGNQPDVIILDLVLDRTNTRIDGIEVCRRLMADDKTKSIPVIVVTCKSDLSTKLSSFVAGAKRYITKPFDNAELVHEVQRALRQRDLRGKDIELPTDPRD